MPFVQRVVQPKYVSRTSLSDDHGRPRVSDGELDAVTNCTLSNALRQLASLVLCANDIFTELTKDLQKITERSCGLKTRIETLDERVAAYDPKKVAVPESDISTFALLKIHYERKQELSSNLFSSTTRPNAVQVLYDAASKTPVHVIRQMDKLRRDGSRSSKYFVCTPVLGQKRKKIRSKVDIDIETRMPAAVEELRRWTSTEALGDITVTPDCPNRIPQSCTFVSDGNVTDGVLVSDDEGIDHKLPSPEEQVQAIALKFPAEVVAVDVSGRRFSRLSSQRRSVLYRSEVVTIDGTGEGASGSTTMRRHTRSRRSRAKRRTTLAGTDEKEIKNALKAGKGAIKILTGFPLRKVIPPASTEAEETVFTDLPPFLRSKSSDLLRSSTRKPIATTDIKKSHFQTLKEWSRNKFKLSGKSSSEATKTEDSNKENEKYDSNHYETVTVRRRRSLNKDKRPSHERNPSYSSSEKSSVVNIPISKPISSAVALAVRLRDSSTHRRFRKSSDNKDEPRSSSGNWSASSESGRASIASEITAHPKSTTSAATSNNSLNHPPNSSNSTRKFPSASASGSVTSEGTLTPDIIPDFHEDMDSSSVYSCDTEGYYTSFHVDSGLKTLKEEETPVLAFHTSTAFSNPGSPTDALSAESEYELFGKGSTSTTASSAGTVCTTLKAGESEKSLLIGPSVPERKSSLSKSKENVSESTEKNNTIKRSPASSKATVFALIHKETNGDISPDSGHNTSSSPTQSANSPNGGRSGSEFEYSECSDMEGTDRIERIRSKTAINSSRIPSMCVITPPQSDDESVKSFWDNNNIENKPYITLNDLNNKSNTCKTAYITLESLKDFRKPNVSNVSARNTFRAPSPSGGSVSVNTEVEGKESKSVQNQPQQQPPFIKASLLPLTVFGKLKFNIPSFSSKSEKREIKTDDNSNEYDEYVTISDIRNNNGKHTKRPDTDVVSQKLNDVLSNKIRETEYVSLDELPSHPSPEKPDNFQPNIALQDEKRLGTKVTLDNNGKIVYNSDSLKRKRGAHTTFQPGPFVRSHSNTPEQSPLINRKLTPVRPVNQKQLQGNGASKGLISTAKEVIHSPRIPQSNKTDYPPQELQGNIQDRLGSFTSKEQVHSKSVPPTPQELQSSRTLPHHTQKEVYGPWYTSNTDSRQRVVKFQSLPRQNSNLQMPSSNQYEPQTLFGNIVPENQNRNDETLKISPIESFKSGNFESSTPSKVQEPLKHAINLESLLLSPKKSTMSNEELYAVIHKSKKKLNIQTDQEIPELGNSAPEETPRQVIKSPESGYLKGVSRSSCEDQIDCAQRFSLSPRKYEENKPIRQTSQMDFKRLLLQQSTKNSPKKLSAVEQLKLSKQPPLQPPQMNILDLSSSPRNLQRKFISNNTKSGPEKSRTSVKLMSPRSQWRFASPRTDVLSSTILEDCREDDSSGSSLEKKSPKQEPLEISSNSSNTSPKMSVSQYIRAKRAQFFSSTPKSDTEGNQTGHSQLRRSLSGGSSKKIPTLETSF